MKNYLKKFSIMFIMALAIIGIGMIHNGSAVSAVTVEQYTREKQYLNPLNGYTRYDDSNENIIYSDNFTDKTIYKDTSVLWNGKRHDLNGKSGTIKFSFYGSSIALLDYVNKNRTQYSKISFDGGESYESCSAYSDNTAIADRSKTVFYVKEGLENKRHDVIIDIPSSDNAWFCLDAIDINGYIIQSSISLDTSTMNLTEGDSGQLTATTTPAAVQVKWSSDNTGVATVDENGKVTGIKEGACTITATINNGSGKFATCTVTVIKNLPPTGDENLYIQLVNGDVKKYTVTTDGFNKFKQWYIDRVDNKAGSPIYRFDKDSNEDYVICDKIEWFELRK